MRMNKINKRDLKREVVMSIPGTEDSLELPFLIDLFLKCNYTIEVRTLQMKVN